MRWPDRLNLPSRALIVPVIVVIVLAVIATVPGVTVRGVASVKSSFDAKTNQLTITPQPGRIVTLTMAGRVVSTTYTKPAAKPITLQGYAADSPQGRRLTAANARSLRATNAPPGWSGCGPPSPGTVSAAGTLIVFPAVRLPAASLFHMGSVTGGYLWQNYEFPTGVRNIAGTFPEMNSCVQGSLKSSNGFRETFNGVVLSDHESALKTGKPVVRLDSSEFGSGTAGTSNDGSYRSSSAGNLEPIVDPGPDPWVTNAADAIWRANPTIGEVGEGTASPVYQAEDADYTPGISAAGDPPDGPAVASSGFGVSVTFGFQMNCVSLNCRR